MSFLLCGLVAEGKTGVGKINPPGLVGIDCTVISRSMWCLPFLNCTEVHQGRRYRRRFRRLRWLEVLMFIMSCCAWLCYRHCFWDSQWVGGGSRFRSFKLCGIISSCRPNPYGINSSIKTESIVMASGPGNAADDNDIISRVLLLNSSVELSTLGVLRLGGLGPPDVWSTKDASKWLDWGEIGRDIFNSMPNNCSCLVRVEFRKLIGFCGY